MPIQSHLHLDTAIGSAPENAPVRTWKTIDREEGITFFTAVKYSLTGTPHLHTLKSAGEPVILHDFEYMIKIAATNSETVAQQKAALIALAGKRCSLVDHEHPDNGSDHAAYILPVAIVEIGPFRRDVTNLSFYYVMVTLKDMSTP